MQTLYPRNLETSVQKTGLSKTFQMQPSTGSNKWWEERIQQEPINHKIFSQMNNYRYLQVSQQIFSL